MELAAPGRTLAEIGDLADFVVAEVIGVGPPFADDPAPPQLVETPHERFFVDPTRTGEDIDGEGPADRRGETDHLPGRFGQPRQAGLDRGLHFRTQPAALGPSALPTGAQRFD